MKRKPAILAAVATGCAGLVALLVWALSGDDAEPVDQARLPGEDVIVAYVGHERDPVTAYDVSLAADRSLGKLADLVMEGSSRKRMTESVIMSRALAQLRESELGATELARIEKDVAAYRETLLVRSYLDAHATTPEVTVEQLRAYYEAHPDEFAAQPVRKFELAYVDFGKDATVRPAMLRALKKVISQDDWRAAVARAQGEGIPVGFRDGDAELGTLPARLRKAALDLDPGQQTHVVMVGSRAYVLRITQVSQRPPKSFEQVRDQIAKKLAPRATKKAIQSVKDEAMDQVVIERLG